MNVAAAPRDSSPHGQTELATLYRDNFRFVWRSVRRLGIPEHAAEDVCQDVFLVAARKLASFEGRSSIRTWLFGIALRVCKAHRRAAGRRRARHEAAARAGGLREERPHEGEDARITLHRLLDRIPDAHRAVYVLMELEGMTAPEVAAGLGCNVNTVYTRLRAARRDLARLAAAETKDAT